MSIEVSYSKDTGRFLLQVPFDKNGLVRNMNGRRWLKRIKRWSVPAVRSNIGMLDNIQDIKWDKESYQARQDILDHTPKVRHLLFPPFYKFKTEPYEKQKAAIDAGYGQPEFAFFMSMGTGKTKVIIDIVSALWLESRITQVLIVCPLSIQFNWAAEIEKHCPVDHSVHGYKSQKHKHYEKWLSTSTDKQLRFMVVGIESLSQGRSKDTAFKYAIAGKTYMAVDESSRIKNADATRTEQCIKIGRQCAYRSIATGTPVTQGPLDLYAQFEFLNTHIFGMGDYYSFRNHYAIMGGYENKEIVGYDNLDELTETAKPFIFEATLDDMVDLPPKIYEVRKVQASPKQKELLKDIARGHAQVNDVEIEVKNVLEKLLRMQQIVNGFYTEYIRDPLTDKKKGIQHNLPGPNPKLRELETVLEENGSQAILWGKFHRDMTNMKEMCNGYYVEFHGEIKPKDRECAVNKFQSGDVKYFIGNPAAGGIGLTLTAARLMVYYSNSFSLEERLQSEERAHRIGQTHSVAYVDIVMEGTVDELAREALEAKQDMAGLIRNKLREVTSQDLLNSLVGS